MLRYFAASCLAALFIVPLLRADDDLKVKSEKAAPPTELRDSIRALLVEDAVQVQGAGGETMATFWFRKTLPSKAAPEQVKGGLTYREIQPTTLIGAVRFPQAWSDFRKQKIPAGVYTLRLAIQPENGDHQGTAPFNEFCLLSPAAKDSSPDTMEPKELHELSANSVGSSHPGVMLLYPNSKPEDEPKVVGKSGGTSVLNVKRPVEANGVKTFLGFGFTVVGQTKE